MKIVMIIILSLQLSIVESRISDVQNEIRPIQQELNAAKEVVGASETTDMVEKTLLLQRLEEQLSSLIQKRNEILKQLEGEGARGTDDGFADRRRIAA